MWVKMSQGSVSALCSRYHKGMGIAMYTSHEELCVSSEGDRGMTAITDRLWHKTMHKTDLALQTMNTGTVCCTPFNFWKLWVC